MLLKIYQKSFHFVGQFTKLQCQHHVLLRPRILTARFYSSESIPFSLVYRRAQEFPEKVAIVDDVGHHTYKSVFLKSQALSEKIEAAIPNHSNTRLAFLCPSNLSYVVSQWACWMSKHVAVPLNEHYPHSMLKYFVEDSHTSLLITTKDHEHQLGPVSEELKVPMITIDDIVQQDHSAVKASSFKKSELDIRSEKLTMKNLNAMILYTSGTTGPPKGVVLTHANIHSQVATVLDAWNFTPSDVVLETLPLHHTHGIIYALLCPLYVGATCVMLRKFDAKKVWDHFLSTDTNQPRVNVFMGVPTMYAKLIEHYQNEFGKPDEIPRTREYVKAMCKEKIRVMISGSDALPQPVMQLWEDLTGHRILERYGMTEIGMALSNPLNGPRIPGTVGTPLPKVDVQIVKPNAYSQTGYDVIAEGNSKATHVTKGMENEPGELLVKGPNVFSHYFNKPEATKSAFTKDGYFKTGDTVMYADGVYRILGRASADIIKSGGYKISALDIQRHLLSHPNIRECAVVGLPDITWGEKVAAVIATKDGSPMNTEELRAWCKGRMASYCVPTIIKYLESIPRNVMGKVNKKELVKTVFPEAASKQR